MKNKQWYVYMLRCSDSSLYTGITTDVQRRVEEHNGLDDLSALGARYTRARRPVELVYQESAESRSEASKREYVIKKMKKQQKESLLNV
ncbi:MAG: GIY-YIG nuclease family protein [Thiotrichaceae bacterium]